MTGHEHGIARKEYVPRSRIDAVFRCIDVRRLASGATTFVPATGKRVRPLDQARIVTHPFIIAELALGPLQQRGPTLALLDQLPQVRVAQLSEVRTMIEARRFTASASVLSTNT